LPKAPQTAWEHTCILVPSGWDFSAFGIAIQMTELLGGEAMVFCGGEAHDPGSFESGDCTD